MQRAVVCFFAVVFTLGFVPACANIQNDEIRTKTEGTLVGAGTGAVLGAVIGGITGGSRGAVIGAAIGAGAGGTVGYVYGNHVADQKAQYADREDWLNACLRQAEQTRRETATYNEYLREELAQLERETQSLEVAYKEGATTLSSLVAEEKKIRQRILLNEQQAQRVEREISAQFDVVREARASGDNARVVRLEREIRMMRAQIGQIKAHTAQLASLAHRISV